VTRTPARKLTKRQRDGMARALLAAPTVLENLFFGWLLGIGREDLFLAELMSEDIWELDLPDGPRTYRK
jgi:hypothetical protein